MAMEGLTEDPVLDIIEPSLAPSFPGFIEGAVLAGREIASRILQHG